MENREQLQNIDQIKEAFNLCVQIQNEGIATAFAYLMGHVEYLEISLHLPKWIPNGTPEVKRYVYARGGEYIESNEVIINELKGILESGKSGDEGELIQSKEKAIRRKQYEELKAEFETTEQ